MSVLIKGGRVVTATDSATSSAALSGKNTQSVPITNALTAHAAALPIAVAITPVPRPRRPYSIM